MMGTLTSASPVDVIIVSPTGVPIPTAGTPTYITASSGMQANANAGATLPGVAGKTTYISGFELTAGGATASVCVTATVSGVVGGTLAYAFCAPTGATVGAFPLTVEFVPPIPASAVNTQIQVFLPALGAGNTFAAAVAHGYQL